MFESIFIGFNIICIAILIILCIKARIKLNNFKTTLVKVIAKVLEVEEVDKEFLKDEVYLDDGIRIKEEVLDERSITKKAYKTKIEYNIENVERAETIILPLSKEINKEIELLYNTKTYLIVKRKEFDKNKRNFWLIFIITCIIILNFIMTIYGAYDYSNLFQTGNNLIEKPEYSMSINAILILGMTIIISLLGFIFYIPVLLPSLCFIIAGLVIIERPLYIFFSKGTYQTEGQVVGFEKLRRTNKIIYNYYNNGDIITKISETGISRFKNIKEGDKIKILLSKDGDSIIKKEILKTVILGIACIIIGIYYMYRYIIYTTSL